MRLHFSSAIRAAILTAIVFAFVWVIHPEGSFRTVLASVSLAVFVMVGIAVLISLLRSKRDDIESHQLVQMVVMVVVTLGLTRIDGAMASTAFSIAGTLLLIGFWLDSKQK